uniref:ADP-ribosylation factor GTPase-activating protein 1 n=1 Tax=Romanomermis culicivorax TaxID=13658 RepID=A0A915J6H8_ROMCU
MDKWKDAELNKMKVGGNKTCREFFQSQAEYRENWNFHDKWNSKTAALYRDKINALSKGESWSIEASLARNWSDSNVSKSDQNSGYSAPLKQSQSFAANTHSDSDFGYSKDEFASYQSDDFFGGKNSKKYSGFGNTNYNQERNSSSRFGNEYLEGALSGLSLGWSMLSRGAVQAASVAKDSALHLGQTAGAKAANLADQVKEGTIIAGVQSTVTGAASKAAELGSRSWQGIQSALGDRGFSTLINSGSFTHDDQPKNCSSNNQSSRKTSSTNEKTGLMRGGGGSSSGGYAKLDGSNSSSPELERTSFDQSPQEWGDYWTKKNRLDIDDQGYNRSPLETLTPDEKSSPKSMGQSSSPLPPPPASTRLTMTTGKNGSAANLIDFGGDKGKNKKTGQRETATKTKNEEDDVWNMLNS